MSYELTKDKLLLLEVLARMEHVAIELRGIADAVRPIDVSTYLRFTGWADKVKDYKERLTGKL